jgi:predicted DNA-binding transcriptional regulator AlpA
VYLGDNSGRNTEMPTMPTNSEEFLDRGAVCGFFGGNRPINPATLYRGIAAGRFPKPIRVAPNTSRWLKSECEAAREALIAARDSETEPGRG